MRKKLPIIFLLSGVSIFSGKANCILRGYPDNGNSAVQYENFYENTITVSAAEYHDDDTTLNSNKQSGSKLMLPFSVKIKEAAETYFSQESALFNTLLDGELTTATPDKMNLEDLITERGFVVPAHVTLSGITAWAMCLTPGATPTISLSVYVYSPASGSFQNTEITGDLRGSQSITMGTVDSVNSIAEFHFILGAPLHQGQVVMVWANSSIGCNCLINGTMFMMTTE
jgi:hypothetical protein